MGVLEQANLILRCPGERPSNMSEELAFKERFYNSGAVAYRKTVVGDGAKPMQCGCYQFLPRPTRTGNEGRKIMGRDTPDSREHLKHERTASDHPFKLVRLEEFCIELQRRLSLLRFRYEFSNSVPQQIQIYWFRDVIAGATADRFDGRLG
jgi:hypothetical protein